MIKWGTFEIPTRCQKCIFYTYTRIVIISRSILYIYGFIECFTTTFLHTHHSPLAKLGRWGCLMMRRMRLVWKKSQKTLDTSTRLHRNETRSTENVGKGLDSQLGHYRELQTWERAGSTLLGGGEIHSQAHRLRRDCWLYWDPSPRTCRVRGVYYYPEPPRIPFK